MLVPERPRLTPSDMLADTERVCVNATGPRPGSPHEGADVSLDAHLTVDGLSKQFGGQTDACLLVEGHKFHVHSHLLAVGSAVFSDIFSTAQEESMAVRTSSSGKLCVTMAGHTISDTCVFLKYLYQRSILGLTDTPSKKLWRSVDKARPIITFAHKFDMTGILEECDTCLSEKADRQGGKLVFSSTDVTCAWAALADGCSLKKLLSKAEVFMLQSVDSKFWQSDSMATYQLSRACLARILRAAQQEMAATKSLYASHLKRLDEDAAHQVLESRCPRAGFGISSHSGCCVHCHKLPPLAARESINSGTLLSWQ